MTQVHPLPHPCQRYSPGSSEGDPVAQEIVHRNALTWLERQRRHPPTRDPIPGL